MRLNAVKMLGISITNATRNEILEEIQKYFVRTQNSMTGTQKNLVIFTPNTEQIFLAQKNPEFAKILNQADVAIPDSAGVVWASTILTKNPINKVTPGVEFMEDLVAMASKCHVSIGLIGGRDNLAVDTLNCLRQKYSLLQDSWAQDGPEIEIQNSELRTKNSNEKIYFERLARRIGRSEARIVFVALGPPKQEYFIEQLDKTLRISHCAFPIILMSVGGSFDIISGRLRRAPVWMRKLGLEWLWRLILEPRRIKRQLALIEFVWLVLREKLASKVGTLRS